MTKGKPKVGSDCRSRLEVCGDRCEVIIRSSVENGIVPKESQTVVDMLVIEDLVENPVVPMKWAPTTHMLADVLNKKCT